MVRKKEKENNGIFEEFKIDRNEPVFTTGVVSKLLSIPVWTLKKLDRKNIVTPKRRDGNDRLYSGNDLNRLYYYWNLMRTKKVKIGGLKVIKNMKENENKK